MRELDLYTNLDNAVDHPVQRECHLSGLLVPFCGVANFPHVRFRNYKTAAYSETRAISAAALNFTRSGPPQQTDQNYPLHPHHAAENP